MATMKELDAYLLDQPLTKAQKKDYRSQPPKERRRLAEWMKASEKYFDEQEAEDKRQGRVVRQKVKKPTPKKKTTKRKTATKRRAAPKRTEMDSTTKLRDLEAKHRNLFR